MERIDIKTPDLTKENIDKLAELFPDVVTEMIDDSGSVVRVIDFDALRDDLSGSVVEGRRERYQFTWPGKARARLEARTPTSKTMRPCPEKSVDWETTKNLFIEGDNLEALKIMRETYAGKIKLIYIDPPYNTGHDFIYDDDFSETRAEFAASSGDYDGEGGRLVANPESNGRFHSDWCSMMYPRLLLARDMLSPDGSIFINIDFNESANLKKLLDEVFGADNFQREIIWRIGWLSGYKTLASNFIRNHDTIYFYSKNADCFAFNKRYIKNSDFKPLVKPDKALRSKMSELGLSNSEQTELLDFINHGNRPEQYPLEDTWNSNEYDDLNSIAIVSFSGEKVSKLLENGPEYKGQKSIKMLRRIIEATTVEGDIVLDFFAGTASTAHAVLCQNNADGMLRKYIMVQLPDPLTSDGLSQNSSFETLCDIGEERLRCVRASMRPDGPLLSLGLSPTTDLGFRVLRVGESVLKDVHADPASTAQASLLDLIDNMEEGATPLDLLFQVLPKFRIPYSAKIEELEVDGRIVLDVEGGQLLACFDEDVSTATIEAIARRRPLYAVFRDASFSDDSAVANLEELFKTFSPDTIRRVI